MLDNCIHGLALICTAIGATLGFTTGNTEAGCWAVTAGLWVVSSWVKAASLARR